MPRNPLVVGRKPDQKVPVVCQSPTGKKTTRDDKSGRSAATRDGENGVDPEDCRVSLRRNVRPAFSSTTASEGVGPPTSVFADVYFKVFVSVGSRRSARLSETPRCHQSKTILMSHVNTVLPSHSRPPRLRFVPLATAPAPVRCL